METYQNFIDGQWVAAKSGRTFTNENPATGQPISAFSDSGADDVAANWQVDRAFEPRMSRDEAAALRKGWDKAVQRAKGWEE